MVVTESSSRTVESESGTSVKGLKKETVWSVIVEIR